MNRGFMERDIITITNDKNENIEYELVTIIENEKTNIKYLVYKDIDDNDDSDEVDLYISRSFIEDGEEIIEDIEDEKEWNQVTKILDEMFEELEK